MENYEKERMLWNSQDLHWFAFIKTYKSSSAPLPPPKFLSLKNYSILSWPLFPIAVAGFQDSLDHTQT